jgi:hypothetical protein
VPATDSCTAANNISNRQFLAAQEQACGNLNWASALEVQQACPKANTTGHFSVIFEKPSVAFEAQNICVKAPTIQMVFEIKRSSTTTLSALASASIASDRSRSDGDGGMR